MSLVKIILKLQVSAFERFKTTNLRIKMALKCSFYQLGKNFFSFHFDLAGSKNKLILFPLRSLILRPCSPLLGNFSRICFSICSYRVHFNTWLVFHRSANRGLNWLTLVNVIGKLLSPTWYIATAFIRVPKVSV